MRGRRSTAGSRWPGPDVRPVQCKQKRPPNGSEVFFYRLGFRFAEQLPEGAGKFVDAGSGGMEQLLQPTAQFPGEAGVEIVLPVSLFQLFTQAGKLPGVGALLQQVHAPADGPA